ncbi:hypothetical protein QYE76_024397 [Lolium multiflorum]|uniref:F-box domain-containing protein n=1 Tax=Lolium multiflorum TaxID=4521 RepID=A0AAD8RDM2_LOLMU|nr:hypothetical protein QYE76_024397 [Lolium multiflorum]
MEATEAESDIGRLPEELLAAIILLTSPLDACRAAVVCRTIRSAADSDAVWSHFLPRDLPRFVAAAERSLMELPSCKARFRRLSDDPALLLGRVTRMWLDKATGGKCYALSARALNTSLPHWRWMHVAVAHDTKTGRSIVSEAARLWNVQRLEIRGKIPSKMLSHNSTYAAYMVFKLMHTTSGLSHPFQEASISIGGSESTHRACLDSYYEDGAGCMVPRKQVLARFRRGFGMVLVEDDVILPQRRTDGWMELELGGFCNEEDDDGEVCFAFTETEGLNAKTGLVVRSIEVRIKQQGSIS